MSRSLGSHQRPNRGESDVWLTPPDIVHALGPFDLDPCAAVDQPWPTASRHLTIADDGLSTEWHGFVWCNPPFGPDAGRWLLRLAEHGNGIGLVPARTETRWFVNAVWRRARSVLFLHGRPHFHRPDGERAKLNSGAPICLVAYGDTAVDRLAGCRLRGSLVWGWDQTVSDFSALPRCGRHDVPLAYLDLGEGRSGECVCRLCEAAS